MTGTALASHAASRNAIPLQALEDLAVTGFAAAASAEGRAWLAALPRLLRDLAADLARDHERSLLHTDIHYDNILASQRPAERWVVIDPKAAAGTPARSAAELLWTRVDELPGPRAITGLLDTIVENGRLDHAQATAWAFVRSVDYWLWGLQNGLTTDPVRCQRVASALAPNRPVGEPFRVQASGVARSRARCRPVDMASSGRRCAAGRARCR